MDNKNVDGVLVNKTKKCWYESKLKLIFSSLLFPPLGISGVLKNEKIPTKTAIFISIFLFLYYLLPWLRLGYTVFMFPIPFLFVLLIIRPHLANTRFKTFKPKVISFVFLVALIWYIVLFTILLTNNMGYTSSSNTSISTPQPFFESEKLVQKLRTRERVFDVEDVLWRMEEHRIKIKMNHGDPAFLSHTFKDAMDMHRILEEIIKRDKDFHFKSSDISFYVDGPDSPRIYTFAFNLEELRNNWKKIEAPEQILNYPISITPGTHGIGTDFLTKYCTKEDSKFFGARTCQIFYGGSY